MSEVVEEPNVPETPEKPRRRIGWKFGLLIGCLGCSGLVAAAILIALIGLGLGIESGHVPDSVAQAQHDIPSKTIEALRELGVVDDDERVLFFYSAALLSLENDGNLFTDRRVISYETIDDQLYLSDATWEEVVDLEFHDTDSWLEDSVITIYRSDGESFILIVGNQERGDNRFFRKLRETWQEATGAGDAE